MPEAEAKATAESLHQEHTWVTTRILEGSNTKCQSKTQEDLEFFLISPGDSNVQPMLRTTAFGKTFQQS